ncbi:MAG: esterase family protein [Clostridiales bacterium]|nr:esterase family protein [Clostridiales bacterium]
MAKIQCNVISYVLNRTVDLTIVIPSTTIPESMKMTGVEPSHKVTEKYPVLYLLHGMGNNHAQWTGYTNVELYAEEHNIAVVMFSGENKFYRDVPGGDRFYEFISKELPEFVTNYFPISGEPENTYIAGLSMGGYGALLHGLSQPERFAAIGAFSAAVGDDMSGMETIGGKGNLPGVASVMKESLAAVKIIERMYMSVGEKDFLLEADRKFKDQLLAEGVDTTWVTVPGFGHEWRFWDMQIEAYLKWIPRTDGYAKMGTRQI